ncbi:hypothetical protein PIB30_063237 [Stylosanthes scabra]|uniref:FLZ-type domain-containing protein n=1 Tax=Stylosanthes scabra TaxID=79078 RepID=A0ABU6VLK0_9FABA|nr:hypothetical protein [Stylosanthes scabra]
MADSEKQKKLTSSSSFFISPRLFTNLASSKGVFQETEGMMMSPTSILDSKPFSAFKNHPFWSETSHKNKKRCCYSDKLDSKGVGLALVDEAAAESRMVVFGSQLKIQIPPLEVMELSEDYTRVISHGPNPRTTHIFGNCIIHSTPSPSASASPHTRYPSETFLSVCFLCNKNLGHGQDIYMYRGERAFCSNECRYQGMLMEEQEMNKLESEDHVYGT